MAENPAGAAFQEVGRASSRPNGNVLTSAAYILSYVYASIETHFGWNIDGSGDSQRNACRDEARERRPALCHAHAGWVFADAIRSGRREATERRARDYEAVSRYVPRAGQMKEPIWLELQAVQILHRESLEEHGGLDGVRD